LKQSLQVIQKHGISVSQNSSESSGSTSSSSVSGSTVRKAANSFSGSGGFLRRKVRHTESNNNLMEQEDNMVNRSVSPSTPGKKSDVLVNSLLEAEVDVLRKKVSELEGDLEASDTQRKLIEHNASENKTSFDMMVKQLNSDISILKSKVSLLEESKLKLESVNDSLTAQIQEKDDTIAVWGMS
jgi:chromosome segregation ATPase